MILDSLCSTVWKGCYNESRTRHGKDLKQLPLLQAQQQSFYYIWLYMLDFHHGTYFHMLAFSSSHKPDLCLKTRYRLSPDKEFTNSGIGAVSGINYLHDFDFYKHWLIEAQTNTLKLIQQLLNAWDNEVFFYYNRRQNADEESEMIEVNNDTDMAREMELLQLAERDLSDKDEIEPIPPNNHNKDSGNESGLSYMSLHPDSRLIMPEWAQQGDDSEHSGLDIPSGTGLEPAPYILPPPMPQLYASAAADIVVNLPNTSQPRHTAPKGNRTALAKKRATTTPAPVEPTPGAEAVTSINAEPVKCCNGWAKK